MYDRYTDMDFADAKPVSQVPALAERQAEQGNKSRITMRVDSETLTIFKAREEMSGGSYQTLIAPVLKPLTLSPAVCDSCTA
ncbi:BrnA antitoxin family protein [Methylomonas sp. EbA]|uniref:BrnA antitoxin family protein n=2 Tax=Methylomonas albis TaxID=1854563 RepID=A0ABR9D294_9GAMM|nr:BrnA antitoxin family protein [Methylomonas albis]